MRLITVKRLTKVTKTIDYVYIFQTVTFCSHYLIGRVSTCNHDLDNSYIVKTLMGNFVCANKAQIKYFTVFNLLIAGKITSYEIPHLEMV